LIPRQIKLILAEAIGHQIRLTLRAKSFEVLSKNVRPLPEKFLGLSDQELKYRQRYVDLITNEETILPNAPPMITPTAMSTTLPFTANSRNSFKRLMFYPY